MIIILVVKQKRRHLALFCDNSSHHYSPQTTCYPAISAARMAGSHKLFRYHCQTPGMFVDLDFMGLGQVHRRDSAPLCGPRPPPYAAKTSFFTISP
jgi:hypothetical protein